MCVDYHSTFSLRDMRLQSTITREVDFVCFFQRDINCAENALTDIYHFDVEIRDNEKVMGL